MTVSLRLGTLCAAFALMSVSTTALAQTAATPSSAPATSQTAPSSAAPGAPAATGDASASAPVTTGTATPAPAEAPADGAQYFPRFRWGISGFGGPLAGAASGGVGGVDARFGAQINNLFGVYGQPVVILGAGVSANAAGGSGQGVAAAGVGALADVTLFDMLFFAAGPELLGGATAAASSGTGGTSASGSSGAYFSIAARAGLALGSVKPEKRQAFTINLDFRSIFTPGDPLIIPTLALGYDSF